MNAVSHASTVIAVLDDEANQRTALNRLLKVHGYKVALFEDGPSLLEANARHPFGCILLDLQLPGMDGFSVLEQLHSPGADQSVVVITAQDQETCADRVRLMGAFACLSKPVDQEPLLQTIRRVLTQSNPNP